MSPASKQLPNLSGADWLNASALKAVFSLLGGRSEVRVVGGAVRSALFGEKIGDIDLATVHSAEEIMRRAERAGIKAVATGGEHGTVTLIVYEEQQNHTYEVTPLRIDVDTDGRYARVAATQNWALDAQRRDFYINALYCDEDGKIYDFVDGYSDFLAKRVRFIGSAQQRIGEDYLRILRFFRFSALYAKGVLDTLGLAACIAHKDGLSRLSAERIKAELFKLLTAAFAPEAIIQMVETGVMDAVLPGAVKLKCFTNLVDIERQLTLPVQALLRLAALAGGQGSQIQMWSEILKLSNKERKLLQSLGRHVGDFSSSLAEATQKTLLYRLGKETYKYSAILAWSLESENADMPGWKNLVALPQRWPVPVFSPTGADVIALGVPAGPKLGQILSQLEQDWIDGGFEWDRADLMVRLKTIVEEG